MSITAWGTSANAWKPGKPQGTDTRMSMLSASTTKHGLGFGMEAIPLLRQRRGATEFATVSMTG